MLAVVHHSLTLPKLLPLLLSLYSLGNSHPRIVLIESTSSPTLSNTVELVCLPAILN